MIVGNNIQLKNGDKVAFKFKFNSSSPEQIEVGEIVHVRPDQVSVIFLQGWKSLDEDLKADQIIAVVDQTLKAPRISVGSFYGHFNLIKNNNNETQKEGLSNG